MSEVDRSRPERVREVGESYKVICAKWFDIYKILLTSRIIYKFIKNI